MGSFQRMNCVDARQRLVGRLGAAVGRLARLGAQRRGRPPRAAARRAAGTAATAAGSTARSTGPPSAAGAGVPTGSTRRREGARVAQRDGGREVGEGLRVDVRARPRTGIGRRPARRPEADVDERAQPGAADRAHGGVERLPAALLVGGGVARVEARGLGRRVDAARQRRPAGRDADRVDAERLGALGGGADLDRGAKEKQAVVLQDRRQAARDDRGLGLRRRAARRARLGRGGLGLRLRAGGRGHDREQRDDERERQGMRQRAPHRAKSARWRRAVRRHPLRGAGAVHASARAHYADRMPLDPRGRIVPRATPGADYDPNIEFVVRAGSRSDIGGMADNLMEGFASYRTWTKGEWELPARTEMLLGMMQRFTKDGSWCFVGFARPPAGRPRHGPPRARRGRLAAGRRSAASRTSSCAATSGAQGSPTRCTTR